jgi:four helix bundle protein
MKGKAAESFEELHVYQRARELTNEIYAMTRVGAFSRDFGLVDQVRRAAVSIMSNVAEGFERGTTPEFIQFLFIAKGSAGEVRAQLQIAADQGYIAPDRHSRLDDSCRRISGMISNFIAHLQSSAYRGEKFTRPKRMVVQAWQKQHDALRAAQLVSIRAAQRQNTSTVKQPNTSASKQLNTAAASQPNRAVTDQPNTEAAPQPNGAVTGQPNTATPQ